MFFPALRWNSTRTVAAPTGVTVMHSNSFVGTRSSRPWSTMNFSMFRMRLAMTALQATSAINMALPARRALPAKRGSP